LHGGIKPLHYQGKGLSHGASSQTNKRSTFCSWNIVQQAITFTRIVVENNFENFEENLLEIVDQLEFACAFPPTHDDLLLYVMQHDFEWQKKRN
jgi:hypothetical protein